MPFQDSIDFHLSYLFQSDQDLDEKRRKHAKKKLAVNDKLLFRNVGSTQVTLSPNLSFPDSLTYSLTRQRYPQNTLSGTGCSLIIVFFLTIL